MLCNIELVPVFLPVVSRNYLHNRIRERYLRFRSNEALAIYETTRDNADRSIHIVDRSIGRYCCCARYRSVVILVDLRNDGCGGMSERRIPPEVQTDIDGNSDAA